jgi:hypothetical protein
LTVIVRQLVLGSAIPAPEAEFAKGSQELRHDTFTTQTPNLHDRRTDGSNTGKWPQSARPCSFQEPCAP